MIDLTSLTADELLAKCPDAIRVGNWNDEWQELRRRVLVLDEYRLAADERFYE